MTSRGPETDQVLGLKEKDDMTLGESGESGESVNGSQGKYTSAVPARIADFVVTENQAQRASIPPNGESTRSTLTRYPTKVQLASPEEVKPAPPPSNEERVLSSSREGEETPSSEEYIESPEKEASPPIPKNKSLKTLRSNVPPNPSQVKTPFARQKSVRLNPKKARGKKATATGTDKPTKTRAAQGGKNGTGGLTKINKPKSKAKKNTTEEGKARSGSGKKTSTSDEEVKGPIRARSRSNRSTVNCFCGSNDEGEDMIECKGCRTWFHGVCCG